MSKASSKKVYKLGPHSLAKIDCYRKYLGIYYSILLNTSFEKFYLLDLFAGEGKDIDGKACSSIAAAEVLKSKFSSVQSNKQVLFYLNDAGKSVIEPGRTKISRVRRFIDELNLPPCIEVKYSENTFEELIPRVIQRLNQLNTLERALCFIDPFGYKYSRPEVIRELLANKKTELLLFIPICFMHRFAAKSIKEEGYVEGHHIDEFISTLYREDVPDISNQVAFIKGIQKQFKEYLQIPYVDVMFIEKEKNQYFALYFFSNNKLGFQKMLEAKWKIDSDNGHGFTVNSTSINAPLFANIDHEDYTHCLQ